MLLCAENSAILLTFIYIQNGFQAFVLSIFEWPLKTGFTIHLCAASFYTGDVYIDQTVYHCTIPFSSCVLHCYCLVIVNNHASRANVELWKKKSKFWYNFNKTKSSDQLKWCSIAVSY